MNKRGCKISYLGNVVCCSRFKTRWDNEMFARSALLMILGYDPWSITVNQQCEFDAFGGKVEYFSER